jgi:RNA polymerase nonessential primary-like sigma factor
MRNYLSCSTKTFFFEIGKYRILTKQEEEIEINNIYRYKEIFAIASASTNPSIKFYLDLLKIRDATAKKTGQKMQPFQWAKLAQISIAELSLMEKNGIAARKRIILCNLRLVVKIAKLHQNRGLDLLDLIQEGTMGLEYSIDRFDRTQGFRFTTYAAHWIKQFITKSIDEKSRMIRLPRNIIYLLSVIRKTRKTLYATDGEYPSLLKISARLNIPEQKIRLALEKAIKVSSINVKIDDRDNQTELLDLILAQSQEYILENRSIQDALQSLILNLDFKERQVINLRYLQDTRNTLYEIGKILEISGEGVRKIESRALGKLRRSLDLVSFESSGISSK